MKLKRYVESLNFYKKKKKHKNKVYNFVRVQECRKFGQRIEKK